LRKIAMARASRTGVTIRPINVKAVAEESQRIRTIYNQAWEKNWGFVPFTEAEIEHMGKEMKPLIVPEATLIAEIEKEPVAFVIAVPDINVAFRQINGRLTWFGLPIGLIKLLYHFRFKTRTGRLIALGVIEKYRRAAIAEMLVLNVMDAAFKRGFTGELSMTLEDNVMVNRFIEAVGAKRYKTFRIYRRSLEGPRTVV
jgi:ribosomal protein S18 acetylase RimI-like enzyme